MGVNLGAFSVLAVDVEKYGLKPLVCHVPFGRRSEVECTSSQKKNFSQLTISKEQSPSREANRFSASQGTPRILWNPTVYDPEPDQTVHTFTSFLEDPF
jgi:hypothetical protein